MDLKIRPMFRARDPSPAPEWLLERHLVDASKQPEFRSLGPQDNYLRRLWLSVAFPEKTSTSPTSSRWGSQEIVTRTWMKSNAGFRSLWEKDVVWTPPTLLSWDVWLSEHSSHVHLQRTAP